MSEKTKLELAFEKIKEAGEILASKKSKEVKMMAEARLENGQMIMTPADEWAEGVEAFLVPSEGAEPVPVEAGTYELENGGTITIGEEGTVTALQMPEAEEEGDDLSDEKVDAIANKVIEKLGLKKDELSYNAKEEIEKRDEAIAELSKQVVELSKPSVDESVSKKKVARTEKQKVNFTKEELAKMPTEQRMAVIMNQYKSK